MIAAVDGGFFIDEGDFAVGLHHHRGVGRGEAGYLVAAFPVGGEVRRGVEVAERFETLVPDAHVFTAGAEGDGLQGQVDFLAVGIAHGGNDEDFAVGRVAAHGDAARDVVAGDGGAPRAFGIFQVGEGEHVEVASGGLAAAQQDAAVGQFFTLGLVAARCRRGVDAAQYLPRLSEVVGVDNAVSAARAERGVEAVVVAHLDEAALGDAAGAEEEPGDGGAVLLVEEAVNIFRDVLRGCPVLSAVVAVQACGAQRVGAGGRAVGHVTGAANHEHVARGTVGDDGGITEAAVEGTRYIRTVGDGELVAPCRPVVGADAAHDVDVAVADVSGDVPLVSYGEQAAVRHTCDGRDAVAIAATGGGEDFGHADSILIVGGNDGHGEVFQRGGVVGAGGIGEREAGRLGVDVRYGNCCRLTARAGNGFTAVGGDGHIRRVVVGEVKRVGRYLPSSRHRERVDIGT